MATPLYRSLQEGLSRLSQSTAVNREPALAAGSGPMALSPVDPDTLRHDVRDIWLRAVDNDGLGQTSSAGSKRYDVVRSTLDLVGRDIAERPILTGELPEPSEDASDEEKRAFQTHLQDRLDIVLTLYEVVYEHFPDVPSLEPGAVFIPLIEDYVELLSVSTWRLMFSYLETRSKRFSRNMPSSKGKALPLLRTINAFLRFLSHTPEDLLLRGRVQLFASSVIPIADKSAINMRGEYNPVQTTWEKEDDQEPDTAMDGDGDVNMEDTGASEDKQPDFYSTLWSLQQYFAYPPSLDGPATGEPSQTPFELFRKKSDFVLSRIYEQTKREHVLRGKNPEKIAKPREESAEDFYPRYLTAKSLLDYEIADQSFRRQILVQYFILFQFLLNLTPGSANKQQFTGGMPKTFVVEADNLTWIKETVSKIRKELCRMSPDGVVFEQTLISLMDRERRYAQWKNDGCPESEWEMQPADQQLTVEATGKWKRHCQPMRRWPHRLGTPSLTRVWDDGFKGMGDLKALAKRTVWPTVFTLEEELSRIEMDEEDDKAMGKEPPAENVEKKRTIIWMAFRHARRHYPRIVASVAMSQESNWSERDLHKLAKLIRESDARRKGLAAARKGRSESVGGHEEGEGEGEGDAEGDGDLEGEVEEPKPDDTTAAPNGSEEGVNPDASAPADAAPSEGLEANGVEPKDDSGDVVMSEPVNGSGADTELSQ